MGGSHIYIHTTRHGEEGYIDLGIYVVVEANIAQWYVVDTRHGYERTTYATLREAHDAYNEMVRNW